MKVLPSVIVIAGAPGTGKSTLMTSLRERLDLCPAIEFSDLRQWHLDRLWLRQGPEEEEMAAENLVSVIRNYLAHGMTPILVTDLREHRVVALSEALRDATLAVVTLFASDEAIGQRLGARTEGFLDAEAAIAWNARVRARPGEPGEVRFDTSTTPVGELADQVLARLR